MNHTASARLHLKDTDPAPDPRRRYEDALVRAMEFAERYLPRDQALEIAHDVASEMLELPLAHATGTLIYIAVTNRLRNFWRATERRAALEGAYQAMRASTPPAWSDPGAEVEMRELQSRIDRCVADMPSGMRDVYVLVREEELSYKEAAGRLGVSVGTVHTQLSRANAVLRQCIALYHAGGPTANQDREARER